MCPAQIRMDFDKVGTWWGKNCNNQPQKNRSKFTWISASLAHGGAKPPKNIYDKMGYLSVSPADHLGLGDVGTLWGRSLALPPQKKSMHLVPAIVARF